MKGLRLALPDVAPSATLSSLIETWIMSHALLVEDNEARYASKPWN